MPTRMIHPIHGATYASGAEVGYNKVNGWVVEEEAPPKPAPVPRETAPAPIVFPDVLKESDEDLAKRYEEKFGRPPHHRMKRESIEAALDG